MLDVLVILGSEVGDAGSQMTDLSSDGDAEDEYYPRLKFQNLQQSLKKI